MKRFSRLSSLAAMAVVPVAAHAADASQSVQISIGNAGVSGIWVLANLSYAGMRAQDSKSTGWRILAFIAGFPGTLLTYFVVTAGSERAYGVDIPRHQPK